MSFGGGADKSSSKSGPSAQQIEQADRSFGIADTLAELGPQQFAPFSTVAETSPLSLAGDTAALGTLGQQFNLGQDQLGALTSLLQGTDRVEAAGFGDSSRRAPAQELRARLGDLGNLRAAMSELGLDTDTSVGADSINIGDTLQNVRGVQSGDELIQGVGNAATQNFFQNILPGIGSRAIQQGAFGGSRQGLAEAAGAANLGALIQEQEAGQRIALREQDIGQRGQDIGAELGRLQAQLGQRGQDIGARESEVGFGLQQQGQQLDQSLFNAGQSNLLSQTQRQQDLTGSLGLAGQREAQLQRTVGQRGQDINAQLAAFGAAPGVTQGLLAPANILGQVGDTQQSREQQLINAATQRFDFGQQAPFDLLAQIQGATQGFSPEGVSRDRSSGFDLSFGG